MLYQTDIEYKISYRFIFFFKYSYLEYTEI